MLHVIWNNRTCIGDVHFTDDSKPDEVTKLVADDVLHIDQGTHNTFTITPDKDKRKNKFAYYLIDTLCQWSLLCSTPRNSLKKSKY